MPSSGEILVDGIRIGDFDVNWIRNNITLVEQNSILFNETIFANIAFGRYNYLPVAEEVLQECVDTMMLRSVIDNLPRGMDTVAGPGGGDFLSGGQKQRVAIARARLRDTPVLILDEPTSALDVVNRTALMRAVREWRKGKTTIIITHDTSQILDRDFLYVLEEGSVVHAGYRRELDEQPELKMYFHSGNEDGCSGDGGISSSTSYIIDEYSNHIPNNPSSSSSSSSAQIGDWPLRYSQPLVDERHQRHSDRLRATWRVMSSRMSSSWRPSFLRESTDRNEQSESIEDDNNTIFEMASVLEEADEKGVQDKSSSLYTRPMHVDDVLPEEREKRRRTRCGKRRQHHQRNPEPSLRKIILTIIPSLGFRQRFILALGLLNTILHASITPIFSYCVSQLFTSFFTSDRTRAAMKWSLVIIGLAVADSALDGTTHCLLEYSGQAWVDSLRNRAMRRVLDQPRMWFERLENQASILVPCLVQNGEDMRGILGKFVGYVLVAVTITIVVIAWSLSLCWRLTLVSLSCCPIVYAAFRGSQSISARWEKRCTEATNAVSGVFVEMFSQLGTVRMLTLEPYFHRKHIEVSAWCLSVGFSRAGYTAAVFGMAESMIVFVCALVFYYAATLITSKKSTVDHVVTVESLLLFGVGYVSMVLLWIPQVGTSRTTAAELLRLADLPEGVSHEHQGTVMTVDTCGKMEVVVEFRHVDFRYPSRPDVLTLRDVTASIPKNSCTAIVGRSGSGKSTLAALLMRLYEVPPPNNNNNNNNNILIGGMDITQLHTPTLRSIISIVPQQARLFSDTIAENISYGLLHSQMEEVEAAAQSAGIHEFITSLPSGYSTVIGDGGMGLSGGQAQRLMIARALIRQPAILILDEATSALDGESANVVRQTVKRLVEGHLMTVIIITHAREMMEMADWVVVMDEGEVIEQGVMGDGRLGRLRRLMEI